MKKIIEGFFCVLLCGIICSFMIQNSIVQAEEMEQELELYASAAVLMDANSGRILYGRNEKTAMAMASTTKIMTCILLLEHGDLNDVVEVSNYATSMPKVKLSIKKGERYRVEDLLYSLMLESHNDSAVTLAEYMGKSLLKDEKQVSEYTVEDSKRAVSAFTNLMNEKAKEIGCVNTFFITPNGLDATVDLQEQGKTVMEEHHTTAEELAKIMSYCITKSDKKDMFLKITRTPEYCFTDNGRTFYCHNHNAFLSMMDGALSGKTGFTNKAGYCYVGALESDGRIFVVSLLACGWPNHRTYKWQDAKKMMEYGMERYTYHKFQEEERAIKEEELPVLLVENGKGKGLGDTTYTELECVVEPGSLDGVLKRDDEKVVVKYELRKKLDAPIKKGTVVGHVSYLVDGIVYRREKIITKQGLARIDLLWCMQEILKQFCLSNR